MNAEFEEAQAVLGISRSTSSLSDTLHSCFLCFQSSETWHPNCEYLLQSCNINFHVNKVQILVFFIHIYDLALSTADWAFGERSEPSFTQHALFPRLLLDSCSQNWDCHWHLSTHCKYQWEIWIFKKKKTALKIFSFQ